MLAKSETTMAASVRHGRRGATHIRTDPTRNSGYRNVFHLPINVLASRTRDGGRKIH
jgi:hypothetical protein